MKLSRWGHCKLSRWGHCKLSFPVASLCIRIQSLQKIDSGVSP